MAEPEAPPRRRHEGRKASFVTSDASSRCLPLLKCVLSASITCSIRRSTRSPHYTCHPFNHSPFMIHPSSRDRNLHSHKIEESSCREHYLECAVFHISDVQRSATQAHTGRLCEVRGDRCACIRGGCGTAPNCRCGLYLLQEQGQPKLSKALHT